MSEEQINKTLKDQNAELVNSHVRLGNKITEQEKEVNDLITAKDELTKEISEIRKNQESREIEAREEFIRRENDLKASEESNKERVDELVKGESDLKQNQESLAWALKKANDSVAKNEGLRINIEVSLKLAKQKEAEFDNLIKEHNKKASSLTGLKNSLEDQINYHTGKAREYENLVRENANKEESTRIIQDDLNARTKTLNEKITETKKCLADIKDRSAVLERRLSEASEQRDSYEKKIYALRADENKLKLGWLELNKRAEDKRVDLKLEKFKDE